MCERFDTQTVAQAIYPIVTICWPKNGELAYQDVPMEDFHIFTSIS